MREFTEGFAEAQQEGRGRLVKEFAQPFYSSYAWKKTRKAYAKSVGGLCEKCWGRGIITPGTSVHHIIPLTPENITDPNITLSFSNLMFLCDECHYSEEGRKIERRYTIDSSGKVICK